MKKAQTEAAAIAVIAVIAALMLIFATFTVIGKDPSEIKRSSMDEVLVSNTLNTLLRTDVNCNVYCSGKISIKELLVLSRSMDDFAYVQGLLYYYLDETYADKGFDYLLKVFDSNEVFIEIGEGCLVYKSETYYIPHGNDTISIKLDVCH